MDLRLHSADTVEIPVNVLLVTVNELVRRANLMDEPAFGHHVVDDHERVLLVFEQIQSYLDDPDDGD